MITSSARAANRDHAAPNPLARPDVIADTAHKYRYDSVNDVQRRAVVVLSLLLSASGCARVDAGLETRASFDGSSPTTDGGAADLALAPNADLSPAASGPSSIEHIVVIVQENHAFDTYFGTYCTALPGSNPTCNTGPACCEAAPQIEPATGDPPQLLDDTFNANYDPKETQDCQIPEMDGGKMDGYVTAPSCGDAKNFAQAPPSLVAQYFTWAGQYALADRYFQPVAGASSSNDMYFATAKFMFLDDVDEPTAIGHGCSTNRNDVSFTSASLGDLLSAANVTWSWYAEGYDAMKNSLLCPGIPADCPVQIPSYPCWFDPSDIPQAYFATTADAPDHMRDFTQLAGDLAAGTLPSVVFVKGIGYHTEHPFGGITISAGVSFVTALANEIMQSSYGRSTLILVTYDESGGWFDHVAPPPTSAVDNQPYGARVPLLALGPFARKNFVSHVTMEHSSVVRFIEWNWLGGTGQLGARDAVVNNLGSLLDPAATGVVVPPN
jgi:phospholipase C